MPVAGQASRVSCGPRLDASQEQVDFLRRSGNKVYYGYGYGDASRLDLLQAASAEADMASDYDNP